MRDFSILRSGSQFWASEINFGHLEDDFGTTGSLFRPLIVNFWHLEAVFRLVKGEFQHCFSDLGPRGVDFGCLSSWENTKIFIRMCL